MVTTVRFTPALAGASAITLHSSSTRQLTKIDGLVGTPSVRSVQRALPGRDGVSDDSRYLDSRNIVLEGELWGATGGAALEDLSLITSAFQTTLLSPGVLTVTYENGTVRWTSVKLAGAIDSSVEGASRLVSYQVQLVAPDPRWYSTTLNTSVATVSTSSGTSSAMTATNGGTAPSLPRFTFGSSFDLVYLGVTVPSAYSTISPQGSPIVLGGSGLISVTSTSFIDCALRTVGFSSGALDTASLFPVLYPGASTWTQSSAGTAGVARNVTMSWYNAWW